MADSWDHRAEPVDLLPKSDLNPLLNPLLERHLGRWAEAYFTSPPERRERAVEELLQELEREAVTGEAAGAQSSAIAETQNAPTALVCATCKFKNCAGQNFCGNCGSPLPSPQIRSAQKTASTAIAIDRDRGPRGVEPVGIVLQRSESTVFSQWDQQPPISHRSRAVAIGIAFAVLLLAGVAYLYWFSRDQRAPALPNSAATAEADISQPQSPARSQAQSGVPPADSSAPDTSGPRSGAALNPESALAGASPKQELPASGPTAAAPDIDNGGQELLQAEQYLEGKTGGRNSPQAARLLWQAVSKHNVEAALLLSNLYLRGDGVPKSCDQARLLLQAAAKKGAGGAVQQLLRLESSGCP